MVIAAFSSSPTLSGLLLLLAAFASFAALLTTVLIRLHWETLPPQAAVNTLTAIATENKASRLGVFY